MKITDGGTVGHAGGGTEGESHGGAGRGSPFLVCGVRNRLLFVALAFLHPLRAHAATITVNGNGDTVAGDGVATLREAITSINNQADVNGDITVNRVGNYATLADGTPDVINFFILGGGVQTISVTSALPTLTRLMTINGYTQLGASAFDGLMVTTTRAGTVIEGLALGGFQTAVNLSGASGVTVAGNFIGTNAAGTAALHNTTGINIQFSASGNTVGGTTPGAGNVIAGSTNTGVPIQQPGTTNNTVEGNYIGTNAAGTAALANFNGVDISLGASGNIIGGTSAVARNVISGNSNGVVIQDSGTTGNVVEGNDIGTDFTGTAALANSNIGVGSVGSAGNTVGGTAAGAGNIIAFNAGVGVGIGTTGTINDAVLGNSIHDNGGTTGLDLGQDGITPNGANPRSFPNDGQNYPVLTAAYGNTVIGTLDSVASATFRVEFFASPRGALGAMARPSSASSLPPRIAAAMPTLYSTAASALPAGSVITATATNTTTGPQVNDTSEFSARLAIASGITATAGTPQSTLVNHPFGTALAATVTDSTGAGLANIPVTFTAPASGASGTFTTTGTSCTVTGGGTVATCLTNASGIATAPTYTANGTVGADTVVASVSGVTPTAGFLLQNLALITISPTMLPAGTVGAAYSQTLTASGGSGTGYTFVVTSGTLPAGLALSPGGVLSGTPTSAEMSTFTVQATDSLGNTGTQQYTVAITAAPLTSIALTGPGGATALTLKVGQSAPLTATGTYADHSMQTIPPGQVQWQSSNPAVSKVDASGNVTTE